MGRLVKRVKLSPGVWAPENDKKTRQSDSQTMDRTRPRVPSGTVADIYIYIYSLILKGRDLRRTMQRMMMRFTTAPLFLLFGIWSHQCWRCRWSSTWGFHNASSLSKLLDAKHELDMNSVMVKAALKLERLAWLDSKADKLFDTFEQNDVAGMHAE